MRFVQTKSFFLSTVILVMCLLIVGFYAKNKNNEFVEAQNMITHTNDVIKHALIISQKMTSLISLQRAYLLTSEDNFLADYNESKGLLSEAINSLKVKISDNSAQSVRVENIRENFINLGQYLDGKIEDERADIDDNDAIQVLKENILGSINDILNEEYFLLRQRIDAMQGIQSRLLLGIFAGFLMTGIVIIGLNYYAYSARKFGNISVDRLNYAMLAAKEGVFDWDIKTNKIYCSDYFTEMIGYEINALGNRSENFIDIIHPDDVDGLKSYLNDFIHDNISGYSTEFRMMHKNGKPIWVSSKACAIRDKDGIAVRIIGTHRDITVQKNIEKDLKKDVEEAEQSAVAKSEFLAHMSHEIRTPLTAITGIAEILGKNSLNFNERQRELISTLSTSTKSLKELVTDILDFSKIEKGEIEFDNNYFPMIELTNEVISMMSVVANEKNISFKIIDDEIHDIQYLGDKARIRQILINLIGNAIKFTKEGMVTVLIKVEKHDEIDKLRFYIQDTGIGIEKTALDTIFEEFRQEDNSVSRQYGGTGLGLPISKNLAILMGGNITVESTKNLGSTFTFSLPLKDRIELYNSQLSPKIDQQITEKLSNTIRDEQTALVVEDYEGNLVILSYMMEEIGLPFDIARNGQEAVDMWTSKHYDIVLMDVQMPIKDGLTATSEIRTIEKENGFNETPIIGMTAHALVQDKNKCIDAGMTDYLSKPIDSHKFKQKILDHIQKDNVVRIKRDGKA